MNEEETYMGEWPVKPYYKRDFGHGICPRYSLLWHAFEPPFCLGYTIISRFIRLCSIRDMRTDSVFSIRYKWVDFPLFGKTVGVGRPYAWFYTSVCADLCIRMYRLTQNVYV